MTDVERFRSRLEPDERSQLAQLLRAEQRREDELNKIIRKRDALIRELRWGHKGRAPVRPETLMASTRCSRFPDGLSRTTLHRIVGRLKDRPMTNDHDDERRNDHDAT